MGYKNSVGQKGRDNFVEDLKSSPKYYSRYSSRVAENYVRKKSLDQLSVLPHLGHKRVKVNGKHVGGISL